MNTNESISSLVDLVFEFERLKDFGFFNGRIGTREAMRWKQKIKDLKETIDPPIEMKTVYKMVDDKKKRLCSNFFSQS